MGARYDRFVRAIAASRLVQWPLVKAVTHLDRWLLRRTNGRVCSASGSQIGAHTLLLHSLGARSGQARTTPLLFAQDGDTLVLLASRGGTDAHPHWYYNLKAQPCCKVSVAGTTSTFLASEVTGEERLRLWQLALQINPGYDTYAAQTARMIPVLVLRPQQVAASGST